MIKNEKHIIKQDNIDKLKNISELNNFPEIKHLLFFGSYATQNYTKLSDIDIAYISSSPLSFSKEADLLMYLNRLSGTDEIDLVNFNNAPLSLKYTILSKYILLYSIDPIECVNLKEKIFPLYFDFQHYQREYRTELKKRIMGAI